MVTNRMPIECLACGTSVLTRTTIGHGEKQTHCYPCPTCSVVIEYSLALDQDAVTFTYGEKPRNGILVWDDRECVVELAFCAETLGVRQGTTMFTGEPIKRGSMPQRLSPFMETIQLHRNPRKFQELKEKRFAALKAAERIGRLLTHVGNGKWNLAAKEYNDLTNAPLSSVPAESLLQVRALLIEHQSDLIEKNHGIASTIFQTFSNALHKEPALVDQFCSDYVRSKRLGSLWRQIASFREEFMSKAYYAIPVLQIHSLKRKPKDDELDQWVVYNKQFDALKALYINGFETLARLSTIFLGLHGIAQRASTNVPASKRAMTIWEFEAMRNANKASHLRETPGEPYFVPHLDTTLRNGVGHNEAHFDGATDEVVIYKQDDAQLTEMRLTYTLFVLTVMRLCSTLLEADALVFHLLERTSGRIA